MFGLEILDLFFHFALVLTVTEVFRGDFTQKPGSCICRLLHSDQFIIPFLLLS